MDERALLLDDAVIRNMLPTLGRSLTSVTYAALEHEIGEARDLALSVVYIGGELILRFEGVEQPVVVTWAENAGLRGRDALMALYAGYGNNIVLHGADELIVHRSQDPRVVIIEYDVHGKIVATGSSYDNRFISVVTIEGRKIVQWRDYMDSLAAMTALSQLQ